MTHGFSGSPWRTLALLAALLAGCGGLEGDGTPLAVPAATKGLQLPTAVSAVTAN